MKINKLTKAQIRDLIDSHTEDFRTLQREGRRNGAFYHLGYVVELSIKACICSNFNKDYFPPNELFTYTLHDFDKLLVLAGLYKDMYSKSITDPIRQNWEKIKPWSSEMRYELRIISDTELNDYSNAVFIKRNGVLSWIMRNW